MINIDNIQLTLATLAQQWLRNVIFSFFCNRAVLHVKQLLLISAFV